MGYRINATLATILATGVAFAGGHELAEGNNIKAERAHETLYQDPWAMAGFLGFVTLVFGGGLAVLRSPGNRADTGEIGASESESRPDDWRRSGSDLQRRIDEDAYQAY